MWLPDGGIDVDCDGDGSDVVEVHGEDVMLMLTMKTTVAMMLVMMVMMVMTTMVAIYSEYDSAFCQTSGVSMVKVRSWTSPSY